MNPLHILYALLVIGAVSAGGAIVWKYNHAIESAQKAEALAGYWK
jgi:hypothetical protein